jgi:Tfp pilus assembly protein PilV
MPITEAVSAPLRPLRTLLRDERGFGLVEMVAALTVMMIGLLAVFSMFQSGLITIQRASTTTTAAALADAEMEELRAIRYEAIGLANSDVDATDATYQADLAYAIASTAATTLSGAATSGATTISVASASGFPGTAGYRVKIDSEVVRVTAGAGGTTWTVTRGADGTLPSSHASGAAVTIVQRVNVAKCGSAPCTNLIPTKLVTGADGRPYRVDTYATWTGVKNQGGTDGRPVKLMTIVVRDQNAPYKTWARATSTFDESTGL